MTEVHYYIDSPSAMEPLFPDEGLRIIEDLVLDLLKRAGELSGSIRPEISYSVARLVRSMNCYYNASSEK